MAKAIYLCLDWYDCKTGFQWCRHTLWTPSQCARQTSETIMADNTLKMDQEYLLKHDLKYCMHPCPKLWITVMPACLPAVMPACTSGGKFQPA